MNPIKHIPNFLTCCNLVCGCFGAVYVFNGDFTTAAYLVYLACVFDFFDGFVARLLHVSSPIGKELDSLADMVTFGFLPSLIIFKMMLNTNSLDLICLPYLAFSIAVFSALRLAKFNIDTRQSDSFIGVPTPANGLLLCSLPLAGESLDIIRSLNGNIWFLVGITLVMSFLLVSPLRLFALKFKNFTLADNKLKFGFIAFALVLGIILQVAAIPFIIASYIIVSLFTQKQQAA